MSDDREAIWGTLTEGLRAHVEVLALTAADGVPAPAATTAPAVITAPAASTAPVPSGDATPGVDPPAAPTASAAPATMTLDEIREQLGECQRCKLHSKRRTIVFGQGAADAELVFVGEGPGEQEDRQGLAFVGKAGELLTKMIGAMGYTRDDVYICNIVKCRPPQNRDPERDEVEACEPFLKQQLDAIRPKVIVALGRVAAQTLLGVNTPISRLRGGWTTYQGVPLMPTFHPAYLLRNASAKRAAWDDLKQVMRRLGRTPTAQDR